MTARKPSTQQRDPWYEWAYQHRMELMPFYVAALVLAAGIYCALPHEWWVGDGDLLGIVAFGDLARYGPILVAGLAVLLLALSRTKSTPALVLIGTVVVGGASWAAALPIVVSRSFAVDPRTGLLSIIGMVVVLLAVTLLLGVFWWASKLNRAQAKVESEQRSWKDIAAQFGLGETTRQNHVDKPEVVRGQLVWPKGRYKVKDVMGKREELEGAMGLPSGTLRLMKHGRATDRLDYVAFRDDPQTEAEEWPGVPMPKAGEAVGEMSCKDPLPIGKTEQGREVSEHAWLAGFGTFNDMFGGDQGCLAGDTMITVNRAGNGVRRSIATVHDRWHRLPHLPRQQRWNPAVKTTVEREVDGVVRRGVIKDIWQSGVKSTFTLTTDTGRSIRATATHPFSTQRGWVLLGNLLVGDEVRVRGSQSSGRPKPPKRLYAQTRALVHHPHGSAKNHDVATHRLVVEAGLNGVTYDEHVARIRRGDVEGVTWLDPTCHVHHQDENHRNNDPSNLVALTPIEHHRDGHDWTHHVLYKIATERVISIVPHGEEMTYDIEVDDDPHNFLANGFVVHNSGKSGGLNLRIGHLACCGDAAQGFMDFKGGVELGPWSKVGLFTITDTSQIMAILPAIRALLACRQELLNSEFMPGRIWVPRGMPQAPGDLEQAPLFKLWVDEVAELMVSKDGGRTARDQAQVIEVMTSLVRNDRALGIGHGAATQQLGLNATADSAYRSRFNRRHCYRVGQPEEESKILGQYIVAGAVDIDPKRPGTEFIVERQSLWSEPVRDYFFTDELVEQLADIRQFGGCELEAYTDNAMAEASDLYAEQRQQRRDEMRALGYLDDDPAHPDASVVLPVRPEEQVRPWVAVTGPAERAADAAAGERPATPGDIPIGEVFAAHDQRRAAEADAIEPDPAPEPEGDGKPSPEAAMAAAHAALRAAGAAGLPAREVYLAAGRGSSWFHATWKKAVVESEGGDGSVVRIDGRYALAMATQRS